MMKIKRDILDTLKDWKNSPDNERKPLLLRGCVFRSIATQGFQS